MVLKKKRAMVYPVGCSTHGTNYLLLSARAVLRQCRPMSFWCEVRTRRAFYNIAQNSHRENPANHSARYIFTLQAYYKTYLFWWKYLD